MITLRLGDTPLRLLAFIFACCAVASADLQPLMRGTLWWLSPAYTDVPREKLAEMIDAQRNVGFEILWLLNCPGLFKEAESNPSRDLLKTIYELADERGMRVIADLPQGGWYQKTESQIVINEVTTAIRGSHGRYGAHPSFYGWYLNYEINPIAPDDVVQTEFWRALWKSIATECHRVAPKSVVTISPFFLLDKDRKRGFVYQSPDEYAAWWGKTLAESGIDILMLQDSGEHLSFFNLADREAFFAATAKECHKSGKQFWVNVETGEMNVADWNEFIQLTPEKAPWRFTPIDWLAQKLTLAAKYGDNIINWGYYPFMDPHPLGNGNLGFGVTPECAKQAYDAYRTYYTAHR